MTTLKNIGNWLLEFLLWALRAICPAHIALKIPGKKLPKGSSVFITGCDTGLGQDAALILAKQGYRVFAGCLTESGEKQLSAKADGITTIRLDVTSDESVEAAVMFLAKQLPDGLNCFVNNAGVMLGGPIEWTKLDVSRREMEVNYFGMLRTVKAVLPLVRQARGRIVCITSIIGLLPCFPALSGYGASKHAAECFVNTLRVEMQRFDVKVINICPGITKTPLLNFATKNLTNAWESAPSHVKRSYGEKYFAWWTKVTQGIIDMAAASPVDAVDCIAHASTAIWPKNRYYAGWDARWILRIFYHLPDWVIDTSLGRILLFTLPSPAIVGPEPQVAYPAERELKKVD